MSAPRPPLPTKRTPAHRAAIAAGVKRAHARKRAIKLIRETVPDLDAVLGEQVRALIIVIESGDPEADDEG